MTKTVTFRNFVGGFLGGALGILAAWYISTKALPFGVLIGVIIGWWHGQLVQAFRQARDANRERADGMRATAFGLSGSAQRAFTATAAVPRRFRAYLAADPIHEVHVVDVAAFMTCVMTVTGASLWLLQPAKYVALWSIGSLFFSTIWVFAAALATVPDKKSDFGEPKKTARRNQRLETYSRLGRVGYFLYTFVCIARAAIGAIVHLAIGSIWWIVFTILGLVVYLLVAFLGTFLSLSLNLINRSGHWLCLGVTLAMTVLSWKLFHSRFVDPRVLWLAALGTGVASGIATEGIQRIAYAFSNRFSFGRSLMEDFALMEDEGPSTPAKKVEGINKLWFQKNRATKTLYAICYGKRAVMS